MRVEGRVFQAALKSYAIGDELAPVGRTLEIDGVIGPHTQDALNEFDDRVRYEAGGDLWGDYSIMITTDRRAVEITPDSVARRFQTRGTAYMLEHPDEVAFPRTPSRDADDDALEARPPAPLALPFWRSDNPWAWLLSAFGFFGLSGVAFWFGRRRMRRA